MVSSSLKSSVSQAKRDLRREILDQRAALGAAGRAKASETICSKLLALPAYQSSQAVMAFSPMEKEVDIRPFLEAVIDSGRTLALPFVLPDRRSIGIRAVGNLDGDLAEGYMRIWEPVESCPATDPDDIDLMVLPAVAIGKDLTRLGYGGGFYDRFVQTVSRATKVAAVFSVQCVGSVPFEAHDAQIDGCVTELNEPAWKA